jgi:hypothetical protein
MNSETSTLAIPTRHSAWNLWRNPIFRRYCQSRLRPRALAIWLLLTVLVSGFISVMSYVIAIQQHERIDEQALFVASKEGGAVVDKSVEKIQATESIARGFVQGIFVFQGVILFMVGTAMVSGGMTAERDEGVIDYQRLVPMNPIAKVIGYLFGLPVREYVMFLLTLPFAGWLIWRGGIPVSTWLPVYTVLLSSALLYHLTGLLIGTVAKNRRWAFLASIGTVFALYTVIPQLSKFGLVFFKYLTVQPVVLEVYPSLLPKDLGAALETARRLAPTAKFFNLEFPELVFTLFSQLGLVITFAIMLCRKWRRAESHLLGKAWATGFFAWIQILLLGNALPLIDPGTLFPSREMRKWSIEFLAGWKPDPMEAVALSGLYGLTTLAMLIVLGGIITPDTESQIRGWRRARKQGSTSLPLLSDAATSFWWVVVMALAGALGWFLFTRGLVESRWFGAVLPFQVFGYFVAVLLVLGVSNQVLLEAKGLRAVALAGILVGVVPLMLGAICVPLEKPVLSAWFFGISPAAMPFFASASEIPIAELPLEIARAVPRAFHFWLAIGGMATLWLVAQLRTTRKAMADDVLSAPAESAPPLGS